MNDKYEEFGCKFKNEADCLEELDEERINMELADKQHFDENDEDEE